MYSSSVHKDSLTALKGGAIQHSARMYHTLCKPALICISLNLRSSYKRYKDEVAAVRSAGIAAVVAARGLAALLFSCTVSIVVAVLGTHGGSLRQSAAAWFHWHTPHRKDSQTGVIMQAICFCFFHRFKTDHL